MNKPYRPVPGHYRERLTIAALCGESIDLHWADEHDDTTCYGRVYPREVVEADGIEYLEAESADGEALRIRLDLIRNMPTPVK